MKVIYHPSYTQVYSTDPASKAGRIEAILKEIEGRYEFLQPQPATEKDIRRVHGQSHVNSIKRDPALYEISCLAAGGAIMAAEMAMEGEASFGLIRPPGHHANPDHCWGFCFFNNIAVALAKLRAEERIKKALILDFDLHFGDGTNAMFMESEMHYFQPDVNYRVGFVKKITKRLSEKNGYEILAVSAGFDRHREDWGGQLTTEDYQTIGSLVKKASEKVCQGRRFAVLEGGYNHDVLGKNVKAFLEGLD
jgi:acetoin utilization deacetylase AcuC-like enzyme